jgi:hypothetical protein
MWYNNGNEKKLKFYYLKVYLIYLIYLTNMEVQFCINNIFETIGHNPSFESLGNYFKNNFYNKIFVKKINEDLVLIYNNFDSGDTETSDLYNECRSLVVKVGETPRVVSYTHNNIKYLKISEYQTQSNPSDTCEESFEGTLISVFNYGGTWHLTTSRCASIDNSYYYDKSRSFGTLFDECVRGLGLESREEFLSKLDQTKCYYFVIVHHENKYVVDYTNRFGQDYTKLVQVITRNATTMELVESNLEINGLVIPTKFSSYQDGLDWIMAGSEPTEGLIIQRHNPETGKTNLMKIHTDRYWLAKSRNPNYPSRWFAYLDIFKKDDPTFRIADYQTNKSIVENLEIGGKQIDITGMIYLLYKGTAEALFDIVIHFTSFDHVNLRFEKINSADYSVLQSTKFGVLRKQLSALQGLVSKQKIRSGSDIISHLRKYVSVEDFIGLLGSIQLLLEDQTIKYIKRSNKVYKDFLDRYLENIRN